MNLDTHREEIGAINPGEVTTNKGQSVIQRHGRLQLLTKSERTSYKSIMDFMDAAMQAVSDQQWTQIVLREGDGGTIQTTLDEYEQLWNLEFEFDYDFGAKTIHPTLIISNGEVYRFNVGRVSSVDHVISALKGAAYGRNTSTL